MDLLTGVNHVAVLTTDLDRFVEFYTDVFELDVVFTETAPGFRHAILRTGPTSWLHPLPRRQPGLAHRGHPEPRGSPEHPYSQQKAEVERVLGRGVAAPSTNTVAYAFSALHRRRPRGAHDARREIPYYPPRARRCPMPWRGCSARCPC